jgi:adenylate kinase
VIHLVCRDVDAMVMRMRRRALKENRLDDADEKVIRRRFEVYQRETAPVLEHYPKAVVHEVDAVGSPAVILQRILDIVAPIQDGHFRNPLAGDQKA